jgi:hypothetical protein
LNDKDLIIAAAALARASPERWTMFVKAYGEYADGKIVECVSAQIDMLPTAQGRAQALVSLGRLFDECLRTSENIVNKVQPNAKRP